MSNSTPGVSVTVAAPPVIINGVNAQLAAVVATADSGPVNQPTLVSGSAFQPLFGSPQNRKYDGATAVEAMLLANGNMPAFYFVRATDGTDTIATATGNSVCSAVIDSLYTGSGYNGTTVTFNTAGKANAVTVSVAQGSTTETFPNISTSSTAGFWSAVSNAVNSGGGVNRGPSNLIRIGNVANATGVPANGNSVSLSGGADGATGVTASTLVGSAATSGSAATGMYTLSGLPVQYAILVDADSSATYTTQASFGQAENILMGCVLPSGLATNTANAVSTLDTAGLNSYEAVLLQGDWLTFNDPVYGLRKISPQGFWLGMRASLAPNETVLNKIINGIVASERSLSTGPYTEAETNTLSNAGIEVITNPIQSGPGWGCFIGRTTSQVQGANTDAYSTMTNFLAQTFQNVGGQYIGVMNNSATQAAATATASHFLNGLLSLGYLALNTDGSVPYIVTCNSSNNPQTSMALGNLNMYIQVTYQAVVSYFNVTLNGGAAVVTVTSTPVLNS